VCRNERESFILFLGKCVSLVLFSPAILRHQPPRSESCCGTTRLPMISRTKPNIVIKTYSEGGAISAEAYPFLRSRFPFCCCRSRGPPKSVGKRDTPIYSRLNLELVFVSSLPIYQPQTMMLHGNKRTAITGACSRGTKLIELPCSQLEEKSCLEI
jgi:hypothetical protein